MPRQQDNQTSRRFLYRSISPQYKHSKDVKTEPRDAILKWLQICNLLGLANYNQLFVKCQIGSEDFIVQYAQIHLISTTDKSRKTRYKLPIRPVLRLLLSEIIVQGYNNMWT